MRESAKSYLFFNLIFFLALFLPATAEANSKVLIIKNMSTAILSLQTSGILHRLFSRVAPSFEAVEEVTSMSIAKIDGDWNKAFSTLRSQIWTTQDVQALLQHMEVP